MKIRISVNTPVDLDIPDKLAAEVDALRAHMWDVSSQLEQCTLDGDPSQQYTARAAQQLDKFCEDVLFPLTGGDERDPVIRPDSTWCPRPVHLSLVQMEGALLVSSQDMLGALQKVFLLLHMWVKQELPPQDSGHMAVIGQVYGDLAAHFNAFKDAVEAGESA